MKSTKKLPRFEGTLYCRPEKRGQPLLARTSEKYCPKCKMKIRGPHHAEGMHHKKKVEG